ncbi:MAG: LTA synthase family protein [Flavobacteriales bacterium]|nr:LTA synthase family protein [Flavobacteriales bacterium]MBP9078852.1 LTA synthase family protein [Flavobacteriales bacterium]
MKNLLRHLGLLALLLLALFLVQRHLFLAFSHRSLQGISWKEVLQCHWTALPMDVSTTGYVLLVVVLLSLPLLFGEYRWLRLSIRVFLGTFIMASALVNAADIGLFDAWGVKIDRKALGYLRWPGEVMGATSPGNTALLLLVAVLESILFLFLLHRIDHRRSYLGGNLPGRATTAVLLPLLCAMALRGGPQDDPINKGWSWFSTRPVLNLAAMNSMWNLLSVLVEPAQFTHNPYAFMPAVEARLRVAQSRPPTGAPNLSILKNDRPNVLVVLLESWTADVIGPLGGDSGVAPRYTRLCSDGLLFTNFYSTGFRTEQGLCALVSGFPSQPTTTVIRMFGKFDRLPSVARSLDSIGYASRYYYGGDASFANTRAYLETMGFGQVHDDTSFPIKRRTRWGAFDEELFAFHLQDAPTSPRPFFHILMTSTSHEPFDAPVEEGFSGSDAQLYRNTVHYTDRCLGQFIDAAKQQDWYANTLIFILADHGHYLPHNRPQYSAARHRIPFLITGGALQDELRGQRSETFGSHVDFPVTLLAQLGLPRTKFRWGRDLFSAATPHSAFWTFNNGFGMADSTQTVVFDATGGATIEVRDSSRMHDTARLLRQGKAELQELLDRYIDLDQ